MLTFTVGSFFEKATAALAGGKLLPLSRGNGYCPDIEIHPKLYIEAKAIGRSGRAIIYSDRASRQSHWCLTKGAELFYYFWRHTVKAKQVGGKIRLRRALAASCHEVVVMNQLVLAELITDPPWVINSGNPPDYQLGWFVPYTQLKSVCKHTWEKPELIVGRYRFRDLTVFEV